MAEKNYFEQLYNIDMRDKTKVKQSLSYISWAAAWSEVKKLFPDATYKIYEDMILVTDVIKTETSEKTVERTIYRPWFDDGRTGWVRTGVTINGVEHIEELPIMDFKNKSIEADKITSTDANKAIQRSITKACARHGLGLYVYEGEDLAEEVKDTTKTLEEIKALVAKKCELGEKTKALVAKTCEDTLPEDVNGNYLICDDLDALKKLKRALQAIRSQDK